MIKTTLVIFDNKSNKNKQTKKEMVIFSSVLRLLFLYDSDVQEETIDKLVTKKSLLFSPISFSTLNQTYKSCLDFPYLQRKRSPLSTFTMRDIT